MCDKVQLAEMTRHASHKKAQHHALVKILPILLFGIIYLLVHGYATAQGDESLVAKSTPPAVSRGIAQQITVTPQQPTATPQNLNPSTQELSQEIEVLRTKVESELEANTVRIDAMRETNDRILFVLTLVGGAIGIVAFFRGRREHKDYEHERTFYEDRRQSEHSSILQLYEEQIKARRGENEYAGRMLPLQEANLKDVNAITTAIAAGAKENVDSLNNILLTFQRIMDFKVAEAKNAQELMQQMQHQLEELKEAQSQQVEELWRNAVNLRRSRFVYTNPDSDLQRQLVEFRTQMDLMQRVVLDRHAGVESPTENRHYGEIYLRRGIIAYYDNDMLKSREMLRIAERFFTYTERENDSLPREQRLSAAFAEFYLALIEKNYGVMTAAKEYIEKSYMVYGRNEQEELLTPTTRAEILSYMGDMDDARLAIHEVLERTDQLFQRSPIVARHDAICALRARLYLGNTYFVTGEWDLALQQYEKTLEADVHRDYSYFASHSLAQVHRHLGNESGAKESERRAYKELLDTRHLQTKVSLDTRILLNALAFLCTREEMPEKAKEYQEAVRELWLRIHDADNLQLRLFSFEKKRPISKDEFWAEVFSG